MPRYGVIGGWMSRERPDARMSDDGACVCSASVCGPWLVSVRGGIAAHSSGPRVRPVTAQQCVAAPDQFGSVVPGRASQYHQYVMADPTAESSHVSMCEYSQQ